MKIVLFFFPFLLSIANPSPAQMVIPLYPAGRVPNSRHDKSIVEKAEINKEGLLIISDVTVPTITVYPAIRPTGTAVIIYPGGGYHVLAAAHEGSDVAKAFNELGVTAFVVKYRLPNPAIMVTPEIGPLQDAQRAVQLVRTRASEFNVSPDKIGIIGFSAGGHLASSVGTKLGATIIDNPDKISLRPDFMILVYPVISSDSAFSHKGSFSQLLGEHASAARLLEYSSEKHVTEKTPPTFLVHSSTDDVVKPMNSIVFYNALIQHHVRAELHIYQSGPHGFGLKNPASQDQWMDRLANWMKANGWL